MPENKAGLRKAQDGSYQYLYEEVDGQWRVRTDVNWEPEPVAVIPVKDVKGRNQQALFNCLGFRKNLTFVDRGIRIKALENIQMEGDILQVRISATHKNEPLEAGLFTFAGPPFDSLDELQQWLINKVAELNGMG